ncbi:unnamed protein product [Adineta steineri]|uniref:Centrosomal protein kizuna n=1 Tax=Adineta steineri TaxID=433720 RepID=A0A815GE77_9BILA|nr:unnamed protein product [Adineta steineri]CAF1334602.1 unnamed protein product [Adineta steineri]CAF1338543.1 unnamed protein product [Adineta steineri]
MLADYHKKRVQLRSKILKCEEERIQLEQKLQSLSNIDSRLKQQQIDHIQSYFTQLNQESQRAKERNLQLLNDITQAERNVAQIHIDVEHLISLKSDYSQYLETKYPTWQKSVSSETNTIIDNNIYNFDRLPQQRNISSIHSPYKSDSYSTLFERHEDQSKVVINDLHRDEQSVSESTSNAFSRSKRIGSLFRTALNRSNLYFFD